MEDPNTKPTQEPSRQRPRDHGYAKGCRVRLHCCWARAAVQELCKPLATHPIRHRSHVAARKPSLPHPSYDDTFNKALAIATRWRSPPERVIPRFACVWAVISTSHHSITVTIKYADMRKHFEALPQRRTNPCVVTRQHLVRGHVEPDAADNLTRPGAHFSRDPIP